MVTLDLQEERLLWTLMAENELTGAVLFQAKTRTKETDRQHTPPHILLKT